MEITSEHSDIEHTMEVYIHFVPSSEMQIFKLRPTTTIRDLKILSEAKCGIPSDVLVFMHNAVVLDDITVLLDLGSPEYVVLDLFVHQFWEKLANSCFNGENERVRARVHIRMNQFNPEQRAFVAAFIAAQKGNSDLFQLLIESFKEEVMYQTVSLSGRSLLHAAVLGGNISCVMTLVINGGWKLLNQADQQQEVPLDMALRLKKEEGLVQILKKYNDMYIHRHWEKDHLYERECSQSDETIDRDSKGKKLSGDSRQDEIQENHEGFSSVKEKERNMATPEASAACREHRLLQRSETPRFKLHIPTTAEENKGTKYSRTSPTSPTRYQVTQNCFENAGNNIKSYSSIKRADAVKLPGVNAEVNRSHVFPKSPQRESLLGITSRHGNLPRYIKRARSPSSPTLARTKQPPKQFLEWPRTNSLIGGEGSQYDVQMKRNPSYLSSSAPNSPIQRHKRQSLPTSSLARPTSPSGCPTSTYVDQDESSRLQVHLIAFDKTRRETLPWNMWKTVSVWKALRDDDRSNKSYDKEDEEEEIIRKYQQMSGHRKSFDVWLAAKEDEKVKKHAEAETEARRMSEQKALEEMQRRMKAKSFNEWLKEKETRAEDKPENDVSETESEARRAQASFKYQQWMKKKDEEALAREEKTRAEEQRKYEEVKKKREEEQRAILLKKKVGKMNSVPI